AFGHIKGEFLAVIPGFLKQLLGAFGIIWIWLEIAVVGPGKCRWCRCGSDFRGPLQDVLDQRLLVYRVVRSLADLLIRKRTFLQVENQEPDMRPGLLVHLEAIITTKLLQAVWWDLYHYVEAARKHFGDTRIGIRYRAVDDRLKRRGTVPVVLVTGNHNVRI